MKVVETPADRVRRSALGKLAPDSDAKGSLRSEIIRDLGSASSDLGGSSATEEIGPTIDTVTAPNFTYDLTGLPRYAHATRSMSGLSTRKDVPADTGTVAAMLTPDSLARVFGAPLQIEEAGGFYFARPADVALKSTP